MKVKKNILKEITKANKFLKSNKFRLTAQPKTAIQNNNILNKLKNNRMMKQYESNIFGKYKNYSIIKEKEEEETRQEVITDIYSYEGKSHFPDEETPENPKLDYYNCSVYVVSEKINIRSLKESFDKVKYLDFEGSLLTPHIFSDSLSFSNYQGWDIVIFPYGTIVFWGFNQQQEKQLIDTFKNFSVSPYTTSLNTEHYIWREGLITSVNVNLITLPSAENLYLGKMAMAHAIAQDSRISIYEKMVDSALDDLKNFNSEKMPFSQASQNWQKFTTAIISLHTIANAPFIYWELTSGDVYDTLEDHFSINKRVERTTVQLQNLSDVLSSVKEDHRVHHSIRLERLIIVLITIEVIISLFEISVLDEEYKTHLYEFLGLSYSSK